MVDFFKEELQQRFSTLPTRQDYYIYDLNKTAEECTTLFPTIKKHDTKVNHRLILVATKEVENDNDTDNQRLISGLEVYEYHTSTNDDKGTSVPQRTIYISKIDTTGSILARGVTRRLVQAYVASQKQLLKPSETCRVHVFARAQPQYLFPESAKDGSKRVLNDRQLVAWWYATLTSDNDKAYWIVPGVADEQEARYDSGVCNKDTTRWNYGSPYPNQTQAKDVIPRFEDDGKARYLSTLLHDSAALTVEDFWTLLGYSEECGAGKLTAIFMVDLSHNKTNRDHTPPSLIEDEQYTSLWNYLMDLDFHDDQANLESTKKLLTKWKSILHPRSFKITTTTTTTGGYQKRALDQSSNAAETPVVNVLVPKRRKRQIN
ncbi:histone H3-K56 acetyltransferase [Chlamydoabsidia padenii]|nr:histone H3-K56 acetyltransferase [Chlamydoabsidia padenii]